MISNLEGKVEYIYNEVSSIISKNNPVLARELFKMLNIFLVSAFLTLLVNLLTAYCERMQAA